MIAYNSSAAVIVLDFEGIGNNSAVGNYYNGGGEQITRQLCSSYNCQQWGGPTGAL